MKILYRVSLFFSFACICFFAGIFVHYQYQNAWQREMEQQQASYQPYYAQSAMNDPMVNTTAQNDETDAVSVSVAKEPVVTADTIYIIAEYDMQTEVTTESIAEMPAKYLGLNRTELEKEVGLYDIAPTLRDQERGFVSSSLISFSEEKIVVKKSYNLPAEAAKTGYYLIADNNYVSVYEADQKTFYMHTDIVLDALPEETQVEIMQMKYIATEEELYNFLESHSS